jgi:glycosyltransferase involved in cell wall biosynthesis
MIDQGKANLASLIERLHVTTTGGLEHGADGWITRSKTADELSDAFQYYLLNPEIAEEHGRNARRSLDTLELDSFSERWLSVYRQMPALCSGK